jgi:hypothetical protein
LTVCLFPFFIGRHFTVGACSCSFFIEITMKPFTNNLGKVHARTIRGPGGTALMLNLRPQEAALLRSFVASVRLRGDKIPSLSLIARRAMSVYLAHVQFSPETRAVEIAALEKLATPFSDRVVTHTTQPT